MFTQKKTNTRKYNFWLFLWRLLTMIAITSLPQRMEEITFILEISMLNVKIKDLLYLQKQDIHINHTLLLHMKSTACTVFRIIY